MPYANPSIPTPVPGGGSYENYFLNNTPEAGFWRYLQNQGLIGNSQQARYAQQQYGRAFGQYQAQAANDPNEGFFDWIGRTKPDFAGDYLAQSPEQRGDYADRTLTPRARFVKAY